MKKIYLLRCLMTIIGIAMFVRVSAYGNEEHVIETIYVTKSTQKVTLTIPNSWQFFYNESDIFSKYDWSVTGYGLIIENNYTGNTSREVSINYSSLSDNAKVTCQFGYYKGVIIPSFVTLIWNFKRAICVESITLNQNNISLNVGDKIMLSASVLPLNATDKSVTWSSSNSNVATVSSNGLVTAKEAGSAIITCKANDDCGKYAQCVVTVKGDEFVEINSTNFPDENFRNYLLSQSYGEDGVLTQKEIKDIWRLEISKMNISSLKGIEYFTALGMLYCGNNHLTTLNLSKNEALWYLYCSDNEITSLDVSGSTKLTYLGCDNNKLTTLDVRNNIALEELFCSKNQLTALDLTKNVALERLYCPENQITSIDVSNCTKLKAMFVYMNKLTALDVSKCTLLEILVCSINQIATLDVTKNTKLTRLVCGQNLFTNLDISKNVLLEEFHCEGNKLATLDMSKIKAIKYLTCSDNQLTTLDVSRHTELCEIWCDKNKLTSLDLSKNVKLERIFCNHNQLSSLTVSANAPIREFHCYNNQIKGNEMDAFISSLPVKSTEEMTRIEMILGNDGNVCTKTQVAAAKAKGWLPVDAFGKEYEGVDLSGISDITIDGHTRSSVFSLSGQRLAAPKKGINIVGGKKVVLK